jgi:hypothetical protein
MGREGVGIMHTFERIAILWVLFNVALPARSLSTGALPHCVTSYSDGQSAAPLRFMTEL